MRQPSDTEVAAWYAVGRNYHRCMAALAAQVAPLGLSLTEHEVLQHLLGAPGLSQQRLAARLFTAKSHLSGVVRDLAARGLLLRQPDPTDARAWCLDLSAAGRRLAAKARALQMGLIGAMGQDVPAAEIDRFAVVLLQIEANLLQLRAHEGPPARV
jgi:MarR family transcriptional regulator, organic hydroperoxide resistance regulator